MNYENPSTSPAKKIKLEECADGIKCSQLNIDHFEKFDHPHLMNLLEMEEIPQHFPGEKTVYSEQVKIVRLLLKIETDDNELTMLEKLESTAPYNIFFTKIPEIPETCELPNCVTFTDLLCPSLGQLKASLQINFLVDFDWLTQQYESKNLGKKELTILYGRKEKKVYKELAENVVEHHVPMKGGGRAHHHSKVGIYLYEDNSLRVVVSTANLIYQDWNIYNQGLWVSPPCYQLSEPSEECGESPTNFKKSLLFYLRHYNLEILNPWIEHVKRADFSTVKVFLVTSVPGTHPPENSGSHLNSVGDLLSSHCNFSKDDVPESWNVIAQASSLATLGKDPEEWLTGLSQELYSYSDQKVAGNPKLSIVFPSEDNVRNGCFGFNTGRCLSCSRSIMQKQEWVLEFLNQWKADELCRSEAMPHIKTYCRVSPCFTKLAWFLMTSANISKSAWGENLKEDQGVKVFNYEVGVMFLPQFFDQEFFKIESDCSDSNEENKMKIFPFIYDLPLTKYKVGDYPYCGWS